MSDNIFLQLSILLALTVAIAFVVRLLRQPLLIAYIVAGIIAGPFFLNITHEGELLFDAFAQFGIVLLLFVVGLTLNFRDMQRFGKVIFFGGIIQFIITAAVGFFVMQMLSFSLVTSAFVAMAITFSSTIVITKLLADKKDEETVYGRYVIGLLLIQDVIAILLLIFLNTSVAPAVLWVPTILFLFGKALVLGSLVFFVSKFLLPLLMNRVAKSTELLFIFTIAWCFGVASLVYWFGFSVEIGAVVAGLSLGSSPYQREISSRVRPLRDFFLILFFIVLGSELQLADISVALVPGLLLSLFVLVIDPLILYFVMRRFHFTKRNAFLIGVTAAQISEFGFILAFKGREIGYLSGVELEILTIVAIVTIIISSYLIEYNEVIYQFFRPLLNLFGKDVQPQPETTSPEYRVWVFGYHRLGWKVCTALQEKGVSFAVVDFNPEAIEKLRERGIPSYYGDASDVEFLETLSLNKANLIILTIPTPGDQLGLIRQVRTINPRVRIIASLYHKGFLTDLYAAGVDYVLLPHLVGGSYLANILLHKPWTNHTFSQLRKEQTEEMKLPVVNG